MVSSDRALTAAELQARVRALCPELASLPPSPLERWNLAGQPGWSIERLWIKRDDLLGEGGSKLRKLLAELPRARARGAGVLTLGHLDSNHALATARLGARWKVPVELVLLGREEDDPGRAALYRTVAPLTLRSNALGLTLAVAGRLLRARLVRQPLSLLPPGGTTARSTAAIAAGAAELVEQLGELGESVPEHWAVAVGSGGTLAGLCAGVKALGLPVRLHGVAASTRLVGRRRVTRLANRALRLLGLRGGIAAFELDFAQLGGGHGRPTPQSQRVFDELAGQGHALDPIFTAKALAGVRATARPGERWLFWHTGVAVV